MFRIYRENEDSLGQLRVALRQLGAAGGLSGEGTAMNSRLLGQLEEVRRTSYRFKVSGARLLLRFFARWPCRTLVELGSVYSTIVQDLDEV